jgi:hypothetical protein
METWFNYQMPAEYPVGLFLTYLFCMSFIEGMEPLGRPNYRWEDNIIMQIKQLG